jgi:hypothetical protein
MILRVGIRDSLAAAMIAVAFAAPASAQYFGRNKVQ